MQQTDGLRRQALQLITESDRWNTRQRAVFTKALHEAVEFQNLQDLVEKITEGQRPAYLMDEMAAVMSETKDETPTSSHESNMIAGWNGGTALSDADEHQGWSCFEQQTHAEEVD